MDTIKTKAFLLIAKHNNFSRAAEELSYTPSALSHIADSLEQELGLRLFVRTKKGVTLTPEGQALQNKFTALQKAENALYTAAAALQRESEVSLRIGAISSIALHLLPALLGSFKAACPGVRTQILVDDNMHHWLEEGVADVLLADDTLGLAPFQPLIEDDYVAVVPQGVFPGRQSVALEELYACSYIRSNEKYLDPFLDYEKFREIIPVASIENDSALYMVRGNIGVTILPRLSTAACPPEVRILELMPRITRRIGICWQPDTASAACRQFVKHVQRSMK